jgi:hypothetical protein
MMDKRIAELLAKLDIDLYTDEGVMMTKILVSPKDLRQFAELIVKECVDVIRKEVSLKYKDGGETEEFMGGHYASSMLARVKIKHHFGVKE